MFDEPSLDAPGAKDSNLSRIIFRDAPYALLVALALVGVAYTSFAGKSITSYWVMLAPVIGVTCVVTRWRDAANREQRIQLMWMQALHCSAIPPSPNPTLDAFEPFKRQRPSATVPAQMAPSADWQRDSMSTLGSGSLLICSPSISKAPSTAPTMSWPVRVSKRLFICGLPD